MNDFLEIINKNPRQVVCARLLLYIFNDHCSSHQQVTDVPPIHMDSTNMATEVIVGENPELSSGPVGKIYESWVRLQGVFRVQSYFLIAIEFDSPFYKVSSNCPKAARSLTKLFIKT